MKNLFYGMVKANPLATFFILAYGISWILWVPLTFSSQEMLIANLPEDLL
jgi:hypothetical protein